MKVKSLALVVISALSLSSVAAVAATTVNGGTVHFKGELVNAACAVDGGSSDQTVTLGQVRTARLAQAGDTSGSVGFNINLNDCDTQVSKTAKVAFIGAATDAANPTVLAITSGVAGSATNVGIQILDSKGTALGLDGSTFSSAITLKDGSNVLPFQARYFATGATTAGSANADATFSVQYE
ncbi:type 1 fimbrial major subunit FimA [Providencia huaxiensis]|uniref:type 1 fimbrial major subunit FimA n=1 Tax=Providencia TaxID=586 RepID=UPI0024AB6004|nr:type 1 fimbrial major subunit FimA [Providencia rettgeri]ELR5075483.1 type 1 fimbrial major subunit FimA [Providencia stuartii]